MECCHGKWDINKMPMSKDGEGSGCSAVQDVHCGVVLAGHGAERELSAKRGERGKAWWPDAFSSSDSCWVT